MCSIEARKHADPNSPAFQIESDQLLPVLICFSVARLPADPNSPAFQIEAIVDPASTAAQKMTPILMVRLGQFLAVEMNCCLITLITCIHNNCHLSVERQYDPLHVKSVSHMQIKNKQVSLCICSNFLVISSRDILNPNYITSAAR